MKREMDVWQTSESTMVLSRRCRMLREGLEEGDFQRRDRDDAC